MTTEDLWDWDYNGSGIVKKYLKGKLMLTGCVICKGKISSEALLCPHCEHPGPKTIREQQQKEQLKKENELKAEEQRIKDEQEKKEEIEWFNKQGGWGPPRV